MWVLQQFHFALLFPRWLRVLVELEFSLDHLEFIGFRMPDFEICQDMMTAVDFPLITTSANISEHKTPQLATEVMLEFDEDLDLILDGGRSGNVSSTIIKYDGQIEIIREGVIPKEELLSLNV